MYLKEKSIIAKDNLHTRTQVLVEASSFRYCPRVAPGFLENCIFTETSCQIHGESSFRALGVRCTNIWYPMKPTHFRQRPRFLVRATRLPPQAEPVSGEKPAKREYRRVSNKGSSAVPISTHIASILVDTPKNSRARTRLTLLTSSERYRVG